MHASTKKEKRLTQDFADLHNLESGTVSIGITVWRSSIVLPTALPKFKKKYPKIEVKVHEGSHQYMASLLEHDKVDFSIFHLPNSYQNVTFEHLQYEKILFCVNASHPLLKTMDLPPFISAVQHMSNHDFMKFSEEPFILLMRGQNIRDLTQNFLNKLGISPNIVLETSNVVTATNAVKTGLGVTFVPEAVLQIEEQARGIVFFIVDTPPLRWEVGFAYKTGSSPGQQARLFMECIRDSLQNTCLEDDLK